MFLTVGVRLFPQLTYYGISEFIKCLPKMKVLNSYVSTWPAYIQISEYIVLLVISVFNSTA